MRRSLLFVLLSLACFANADRIIFVPRGGKIPYGTIRGEFIFEPSKPESNVAFLGVGVTTYIDAEIASYNFRGERDFTELNLNFNLNAPLAGLAPGISFGVLDVADQSPLGIRGYVAISFQEGSGVGPLAGSAVVETTIGAFIGRESNAFVGVSLPVNERFRFLAEHDGSMVSAGAELRTQWGPLFKVVFREGQTLLSAGATVRF